MKKVLVLLYLLTHAFITFSQLATYDFTGNSTTENIDVVAQPANATFSTFTRSNVRAVSGAGTINSDSWTAGAQPAINYSKYLEYSVQADAGYYLDIQSINFKYRGSAAVANIYRVEVSNDNFASVWAFTEGVTTIVLQSSTWDFADIQSTVGGKISFRFYVYGTTRADLGGGAISAFGTFRADDVSTFGQIVAPPPVPVSMWSIYFGISLISVYIVSKNIYLDNKSRA